MAGGVYKEKGKMETRYLQEYLTFAKELSYSEAARKLYITRPTLKSHIRELERELGCELVVRGSGEVALSVAGRKLVSRAGEVLSVYQGLIDEFKTISDNLLTVTIASTNLPWLESLIYRARHRIQERYPQKHIEIISVSGPLSTLTALDGSKNDIVVAGCKSYLGEDERPRLPDGVEAFWLQCEEIKLLVTQDNPLFTLDQIRARDLDGKALMLPPDLYDTYIRDGVVDYFAQAGARITVHTSEFHDHFEYSNYDFSEYVGIVPTTLMSRLGVAEREEVRAFSLVDLPIYTDFFAVYRSDFTNSENGRLLIEEMKAACIDTISQHVR
jgi:DNA-binding transcriptional LysR family regulator